MENRGTTFILLVGILCMLSCGSGSVKSLEYTAKAYEHPIKYAPQEYVCFLTTEELNIDGKADEQSWKDAPWTMSFVDIQGDLKERPFLDTKAKMLWDENYFYFYVKMEEPHVWATLKNRDDIMFRDDDFEIFIDPDGDSHNYYELEFNAFNTLWDLILLSPYRVSGGGPKVLDGWNLLGLKSAVHIEGTLNNPSDEDQYWSVEIAIPWNELEEFTAHGEKPMNGEQWRVNFSRVDWTMDIEGDAYKKRNRPSENKPLPEDNWVWSPTGFINMHMPEMWGYVQFSSRQVSTSNPNIFTRKNDEQVKWSLWNLYWQQLEYYDTNKVYSDDLRNFSIPENGSCTIEPKIYTTPNHFEITSPSCDEDGEWIIRTDGKIYHRKSDMK